MKAAEAKEQITFTNDELRFVVEVFSNIRVGVLDPSGMATSLLATSVVSKIDALTIKEQETNGDGEL